MQNTAAGSMALPDPEPGRRRIEGSLHRCVPRRMGSAHGPARSRCHGPDRRDERRRHHCAWSRCGLPRAGAGRLSSASKAGRSSRRSASRRWVACVRRWAAATRPSRWNSFSTSISVSRRLGDSCVRLVIPAYHAESGIHLFKTSHHPRLRVDWRERMAVVARATGGGPDLPPAPSARPRAEADRRRGLGEQSRADCCHRSARLPRPAAGLRRRSADRHYNGGRS